MKRIPWFEIILIIVILSVHTYAAFSDAHNFPNRWYTRDDAYYYYKVAQNISEGNGSTFDGINPANGYHPLWMLLCIPIFALARSDLILPLRILLIVMALLNAGTAILIYRMTARIFHKPIAMLAASYWAFSSFVFVSVTQFGLETGLATFSVALLLERMQVFELNWRKQSPTLKQIALLAVFALLAQFSRLDLVFLAMLTGAWIVFRKTPLRYFLPADILILTAVVFTSFAARLGLPEYYQYTRSGIIMAALSLAATLLALYFFGAYQNSSTQSLQKTAVSVGLAVTAGYSISGVTMILLTAAGILPGFPRSALLLGWFASLLLVYAVRLAAKVIHTSKNQTDDIHPLALLKDNWKIWLSEGAVYYGVTGGALGLYMLWSKLTFGIWSPVSGQIKRWWGSLPGKVYGGSPRSIAAMLGLEAGTDFNAWEPLTSVIKAWSQDIKIWPGRVGNDERFIIVFILVVILFGAILFINRKKTVRAMASLGLAPLLAGSGLQVLTYTGLGYSAVKEWYWASQMIFIVLLAGLLLDQLLLPFWSRFAALRPVLVISAGVISISMAWNFFGTIQNLMPYGKSSPDQPYMDVLALLEENTEPGALIGMTGGGNVGYYITDRTIVNMDGLINSASYFEALKSGQAGAYLAEMGMDYIFANPELLEGLPYKGQFTDYYQQTESAFGKKQIMPFNPVPEN
ncbi:MAG: hypothetical protein JXA13_14005 [Anaerolineales bacterium]|nr:hypothetical protein [Anaerolineales bacterium]